MATQQIKDRQVINTIEDTSKYQTGDARRLRVMADPLRIPVAERQSGANQLAQALSSVKPELMNFAIDRQADTYGKDITKGEQLAQTGGVASGEMQQYGYDKVKAVNDWTDWQVKITQDYEQNFDKENGNVEDFLKTQWETHPFKDKSTTYTDSFSALAGKTMAKVREAHGVFKVEKQAEQNNTELVRMFAGDIKDVMGAGQDYTTKTYEIRRENLKQQFPGKTNSQLDELAYQAALQAAQESGDTKLLNIFKSPHSDGTPGLYEIPKWKEKIDSEIRAIISAKNTARSASDTNNSKLLREAADVKEREIVFDLIRANGLDDPTEQDKAIVEIVTKAEAASKAGIPISDSMLKTLMSSSSKVDKEQETAYQQQNFNKLFIGTPSQQQIYIARNNGDISQTGFEKLMNSRKAAENRAASSGNKEEKSITTNSFYKDGDKAIKQAIGFSSQWGAPNTKLAQERYSASVSEYKAKVEEMLDEGASPKDAAREAAKSAIETLTKAGHASEAHAKAKAELDPVKYKKEKPTEYYTDNLNVFREDIRKKAVPSNMPYREQQKLILRLEAEDAEKKRAKSRESVK